MVDEQRLLGRNWCRKGNCREVWKLIRCSIGSFLQEYIFCQEKFCDLIKVYHNVCACSVAFLIWNCRNHIALSQTTFETLYFKKWTAVLHQRLLIGKPQVQRPLKHVVLVTQFFESGSLCLIYEVSQVSSENVKKCLPFFACFSHSLLHQEMTEPCALRVVCAWCAGNQQMSLGEKKYWGGIVLLFAWSTKVFLSNTEDYLV